MEIIIKKGRSIIVQLSKNWAFFSLLALLGSGFFLRQVARWHIALSDILSRYSSVQRNYLFWGFSFRSEIFSEALPLILSAHLLTRSPELGLCPFQSLTRLWAGGICIPLSHIEEQWIGARTTGVHYSHSRVCSCVFSHPGLQVQILFFCLFLLCSVSWDGEIFKRKLRKAPEHLSPQTLSLIRSWELVGKYV